MKIEGSQNSRGGQDHKDLAEPAPIMLWLPLTTEEEPEQGVTVD